MSSRSPLLLSAALSLILGVTGCAATWEGMKRDSEGLFGESEQENIVVEAQRLLNEKGYDAGAADGLVGPRTTRAILAYQADHGLHRTGYVDDELVASLRGETGGTTGRQAQTGSETKEEDWVDPY